MYCGHGTFKNRVIKQVVAINKQFRAHHQGDTQHSPVGASSVLNDPEKSQVIKASFQRSCFMLKRVSNPKALNFCSTFYRYIRCLISEKGELAVQNNYNIRLGKQVPFALTGLSAQRKEIGLLCRCKAGYEGVASSEYFGSHCE